MGMPNIPDIKPDIDLEKEDVINLLLVSVALEELGLAHIINVEGEKAQFAMKAHCTTLDDLLLINDKIDRILKDVIKKEILLQFKLDHIMDLIEKDKCKKKSRYE